ncbi:MAG TPA: hypothetical protein VF294_08760 [Polyangiaceae bacterium]
MAQSTVTLHAEQTPVAAEQAGRAAGHWLSLVHSTQRIDETLQ